MNNLFEKLKGHKAIILVLLVALLTAGADILWRTVETRPPHWDMARHLWTSLNYLDLVKAGRLGSLYDAYFYYPPFLYYVAIPFYLLFGTSMASAVASNIVFIFILAFSVYGIGSALWNKKVGMTATLFILASPMVISQFKEFQIDAPLTAMVSLSVFMLIKSRELSNTTYSGLLGVSLGLGMLTKWTFPFIMAAPVLGSLILATHRMYRHKDFTIVKNVLLAVFLALLISLPWYWPHHHDIKADLLANGVSAGAREGDPVVGSLASNLWYLKNLVNIQLYLPLLGLFATGLVFLRKKDALKKNLYPVLLLLGTILFFTMLRNKDARYTLPALVGVAIMGTYWISYLKLRTQKIAVGLMAILYLFSFVAISTSWGKTADSLVVKIGTFNLTVFARQGYIIGPPTHEKWYQEEAIKSIASRGSSLNYTGPDTIWFNSWGLMYYTKLHSIQLLPAKGEFNLIRDTSSISPCDKTYTLPDSTFLHVCGNRP